MLYLPITREWIVSPVARRVYFGCAIAALYLLATCIGVVFALAFQNATLADSPLLSAVLRLALVPGIVGAATLWVAMWYFWFSYDDSHWSKKAGWFLVLFFSAPIGTLLYFFVVYRRTPLFASPLASAEGASPG